MLLFCSGCLTRSDANAPVNTPEQAATRYASIKKHAKEAKVFCARRNMNTELCLLADLGIHSGKERLVVWDFRKDTIMASGMVSHGCGSMPWGKDRSKDKPVFSNENNSHCSSLGKYKIGERGYSEWGIHVKYLLHGLEPSNNNALQRQIVLHGWDAVSAQEVYPDGLPEGWGCPAVSNQYMQQLDIILKKSNRPVLLWIYN